MSYLQKIEARLSVHAAGAKSKFAPFLSFGKLVKVDGGAISSTGTTCLLIEPRTLKSLYEEFKTLGYKLKDDKEFDSVVFTLGKLSYTVELRPFPAPSNQSLLVVTGT